MEELLNKLIEKGRVPFGNKRITNVSWQMQYVWTYNWVFWSNHNAVQFWKSIRELVSRESWLWQFVCENGMVEEDSPYYTPLNGDEILCTSDERICYYNCDWYPKDKYYKLERMYYEFWVVESALCDEDELEEFLLDNIKIDETT